MWLRLSVRYIDIATSWRVCDLLAGPAGMGKSTALARLLAAWEAEQGTGSVKGLAHSAAAAANLGAELGITTENTAKWLAKVNRRLPAHQRSPGSGLGPTRGRRPQLAKRC